MCTEIYLTSDRSLPLIEWDENDPGFAVLDNLEQTRKEFVRRFLSEPYIYKVYSYMGCGCGFAFDEHIKASDAEAYEANIKDVKELFSYLRAQAHHANIRLFVWDWSGDKWEQAWENPSGVAANSISLDPNATLSDEFWFEGNSIYQVAARCQDESNW
jgi:hypothetical protein